MNWNKDYSATARIKALYNSLLPKERQIASFILNNLNETLGLTIRQFAEKVTTSCSSVTRFAQKLGYSGYKELQLAIAVEAKTDVKRIHSTVLPGDNVSDIIRKVCLANAEACSNTAEILSPEKLLATAKAIQKAKRVFLFADGPTQIVAVDLYNKLLRLGIISHFTPDRRFQSILTTLIEQGDVAIGFSLGGSSKAAVDALRSSKQQGAFTIAITSQAKSPLAQLADITLLGSLERSLVTGTLLARISQICVVDSLFMVLVNLSREASIKSIELTKKAIDTDSY